MNFEIETSRSQKLLPIDRAKEVFSEHLHDHTDALFFDAKKECMD